MELASVLTGTIPTEIEGVHVKDLTIAEFEEFTKVADSLEGAAFVLELFLRVVRDADGQPFEDVRSVEDVEHIGIASLRRIVDVTMETLAPSSPKD